MNSAVNVAPLMVNCSVMKLTAIRRFKFTSAAPTEAIPRGAGIEQCKFASTNGWVKDEKVVGSPSADPM